MPCSKILHQNTCFMMSLNMSPITDTQQVSLLLLGLCLYIFIFGCVRLGICVYVFRNSLISVQWHVMRQQWLGGTAEWSYILSMALSLLGNRLAPRLHTSPFHWPQMQKWGMRIGTQGCQVLLSVTVQSWFINMLLNSLWLCHFSPETPLWLYSGLGAITPYTLFLSRMLFIGSL